MCWNYKYCNALAPTLHIYSYRDSRHFRRALLCQSITVNYITLNRGRIYSLSLHKFNQSSSARCTASVSPGIHAVNYIHYHMLRMHAVKCKSDDGEGGYGSFWEKENICFINVTRTGRGELKGDLCRTDSTGLADLLVVL